MAYLAFAEGDAGIAPWAPVITPRADEVTPRLTALEWSVVALARRDRLSSLDAPGAIALAMGKLFGTKPSPRLADPRLEALRRIAVLSWHYGYVVPSYEVRDFIAAGFSPRHYELIVDSIGADRLAQRNERFRR